jgi:hypothetical protein
LTPGAAVRVAVAAEPVSRATRPVQGTAAGDAIAAASVVTYGLSKGAGYPVQEQVGVERCEMHDAEL